MADLDGLKFSETHEWVREDGKVATVGITDYAQAQLGDVIYVELPKVGTKLEPGGKFGVIESVKAASDLFTPVGGEVSAANEDLTEHPELVNQDPYGKGWLIKLQGVKANPKLLDQKAYDAFTKTL